LAHVECGAPSTDPPKSMSWDVPVVGLAHDPRRGFKVRFYYILTTCEPHRQVF
jgi:hypothetical protein